MTKRVRIENADTSDYKVIVEVWQKVVAVSPETGPGPDVLVKTLELAYPTAMTGDDVYLTSSQYIVVKER